MLNVPNIITVLRIFLVPVFLMVFWLGKSYPVNWGMGILAFAGVTDIIDGYLARKLNMVTPAGKFLDPLADKLMVISVMVSLLMIDRFPLWLVILIIGKELVLVFGSFLIVVRKHSQISANFYGKAATTAIYAALFTNAFKLPGNSAVTVIAGILSIIALINYISGYSIKHTVRRTH